jgi:hypothetical protein
MGIMTLVKHHPIFLSKVSTIATTTENNAPPHCQNKNKTHKDAHYLEARSLSSLTIPTSNKVQYLRAALQYIAS